MPQFKRKLLKYRPLLKPFLYITSVLLIIYIGFNFLYPLYRFSKENNLTFNVLMSAILDKEPPLKKNDGRTNIVILGVSGGDHKGADLTDTIIFMSIDFTKKDALMVSVPRDLWLPSLKTKINSTYHYGEEKKKGGGLILTRSSISEVLGQPVSYGFVIDFSGFKDLIDLVGGIDVDVEQGFEDKKFPIPGKGEDLCGGDPEFACRYEHIKFKKGLQHMDGDTALKYVRSRSSDDGEGTDFSRSKRQQQVIFALMDRMKYFISLKNFSKVKQLIPIISEAVDTDMNLSEQILLGRFFLNLKDHSIRHIILDAGDEQQNRPGLLVNPPLWQYDGVWVLAPRVGDFTEIHEYITCNLQDSNCSIEP